MFQFEKPGRRDDFDYPQMAKEAVTKALEDSRLKHSDIKQACVGYVYGKYIFNLSLTGMCNRDIHTGDIYYCV